MTTSTQTAAAIAHQLLFDALVEMRAEGYAQQNKVVFHLANLFHHAALDLKAATEGELTYDDVLRRLEARAGEIGCEQWLESALTRIEGARAANPAEPGPAAD
jgi:isopentenyl diphosphate isomerase/L-lactate dehydrogenase-like FMN-dependent dehydrogenase